MIRDPSIVSVDPDPSHQGRRGSWKLRGIVVLVRRRCDGPGSSRPVPPTSEFRPTSPRSSGLPKDPPNVLGSHSCPLNSTQNSLFVLSLISPFLPVTKVLPSPGSHIRYRTSTLFPGPVLRSNRSRPFRHRFHPRLDLGLPVPVDTSEPLSLVSLTTGSQGKSLHSRSSLRVPFMERLRGILPLCPSVL